YLGLLRPLRASEPIGLSSLVRSARKRTYSPRNLAARGPRPPREQVRQMGRRGNRSGPKQQTTLRRPRSKARKNNMSDVRHENTNQSSKDPVPRPPGFEALRKGMGNFVNPVGVTTQQGEGAQDPPKDVVHKSEDLIR